MKNKQQLVRLAYFGLAVLVLALSFFLDKSFIAFFRNFNNPVFDAVFSGLTFLGNPFFILVFAVIALYMTDN